MTSTAFRSIPAYVREFFERHPHASIAEAEQRLGLKRRRIYAYRWQLRRMGLDLPSHQSRRPRLPIDPALEVLEGAASTKRAAAALDITPNALVKRLHRRGLIVEDVRSEWVVSGVRLALMLGYSRGGAHQVVQRLRRAGAPIKHVTYYRRMVDLTEFVGWAATDAGRKAIDMQRIADAELRDAIRKERAL